MSFDRSQHQLSRRLWLEKTTLIYIGTSLSRRGRNEKRDRQTGRQMRREMDNQVSSFFLSLSFASCSSSYPIRCRMEMLQSQQISFVQKSRWGWGCRGQHRWSLEKKKKKKKRKPSSLGNIFSTFAFFAETIFDSVPTEQDSSAHTQTLGNERILADRFNLTVVQYTTSV